MKVDIKELKRLAEAATPGPWRECGHDKGGCKCGQIWSVQTDEFIGKASRGDDEVGEPLAGQKANAAYIAATNPSVVLALIEYIEELEQNA